jgi:tRNA pseudouridine13 synthase
MAARLKVTSSALVFLSHQAVRGLTIQYASVRTSGPQEIKGDGFVARRIGWGSRALRTKDLTGSRFTLVVRALSAEQAPFLAAAMANLGTYGLPNYFDDARFGSRSRRDFIGKEILKRDAERVVHMYLAERLASDSRAICDFKRLVASHWGQWGYLLHQAPRPSNFRSVITYLKDHPHDYRKAVNLIQDKLLSAFLAAYQAWVWNLIVARYLDQDGAAPLSVRIARRSFPIPELGPAIKALCAVDLDLPRLTAHYPGDFEAAVVAAFAEESLTLRDFKARILRRVYLPKRERALAFVPQAVVCSVPVEDETAPGCSSVTISFTLSPGQYATLVIKAAAAMIGAELESRRMA